MVTLGLQRVVSLLRFASSRFPCQPAPSPDPHVKRRMQVTSLRNMNRRLRCAGCWDSWDLMLIRMTLQEPNNESAGVRWNS
jgi:hypothetical protein